jgi:hypothetical protein
MADMTSWLYQSLEDAKRQVELEEELVQTFSEDTEWRQRYHDIFETIEYRLEQAEWRTPDPPAVLVSPEHGRSGREDMGSLHKQEATSSVGGGSLERAQTVGDLDRELITTRCFLTHLRLVATRWVGIIEASDQGVAWGGAERCPSLYRFGDLLARIRRVDESFWRELCAQGIPNKLRRNLKPPDFRPSWADRATIRPPRSS